VLCLSDRYLELIFESPYKRRAQGFEIRISRNRNMKFLIVAALATLALASSRGSWSIDRPLQAKTEYRYRYEGSVMTGLPVQNTDVTLTRIRSDVHVQVVLFSCNKFFFFFFSF